MKKCISLIAAVIIVMLMLTACGEPKTLSPEQISAEDITQVEATDALYSSYLYIVEDADAIAELVDMYNALTYTDDCDKQPMDILGGVLYSLTFSGGADAVYNCYICPDGYLMIGDDAFEKVYTLTGGFDEDKLRSILGEYNTFE